MFNMNPYLAKIRPYLGTLVIIVSLGGLWYPVLGYFMLVVMGTLFITSIFRGRWFCGNLCPRGSYFDYGIIKISKKRKIRSSVSSMWVRVPVFTAMITFMMYRISVTFAAQNTFELIGTILVSMCIMTTI